eukprot:jgi/Chlat1/5258/Chrsp33S05091
MARRGAELDVSSLYPALDGVGAGGGGGGVSMGVGMGAGAVPEHGYSPPAGQTTSEVKITKSRKLGSGSMGTVYQGVYQGQDVAVKRLNTERLSRAALQEFEELTGVYQALTHPHVAKVIGAVTEHPPFALLMEYAPAPSSLLALLQGQGQPAPLPLPVGLDVMTQIARGLSFLHSRRIVHGDMKSSNVLVFGSQDADGTYEIKLTDYGYPSVKAEIKRQTATESGVRWTAPEILTGGAPNEASDMYSFAMTCFEIVSGDVPFADMPETFIGLRVVNQRARPSLPETCPPALSDLLVACWHQDPARRPDINSVLARLDEIESARDPFKLKRNLFGGPEPEQLVFSAPYRSPLRAVAPVSPAPRQATAGMSSRRLMVDDIDEDADLPSSSQVLNRRSFDRPEPRAYQGIMTQAGSRATPAGGSLRYGAAGLPRQQSLPEDAISLLPAGYGQSQQYLDERRAEALRARAHGAPNVMSNEVSPQKEKLQSHSHLGSLKGHKKPIGALVAANGVLYSGSLDSTVRTWSVVDLKSLNTLKGHSNYVETLTVLDGFVISGSSDKHIRVWRETDGKSVEKIKTGSDAVQVLGAGEGLLFSAGSEDAAIKVWKLGSWKKAGSLSGHGSYVNCMLVHGGFLFSAAADSTIKVWRLSDLTCVATLKGHRGSVECLVTIDGVLYSGSEDRTMRAWSLSDYSCTHTVQAHGSAVVSLAATDRGTLFSGSEDGVVKGWSVPVLEAVSLIRAHRDTISALAYADGVLFSGSSEDNVIKAWKV